MKWFWKIVAYFKRISIKANMDYISDINEKVKANGNKVPVLDKIKGIKKKFESNKEAYLEYVNFMHSKHLELKDSEIALLNVIEETEDIVDPKAALERELKKSHDKYDKEYAQTKKSGEKLLDARKDAVNTIKSVEELINSIASHPKEFDKEFKSIKLNREKFKDAFQYGLEQKKQLENSVKGIGASVATGVAVAGMAPSAALWVATTFGTASTGTAISALSGAAATNAALAWLGGGALAAGGAGMAAGQALLALAGPVGWSIAGGSVLTSLIMLWRKKSKVQEEKKNEILRMKNCTEALQELRVNINSIYSRTITLNQELNQMYKCCASLENGNYVLFTNEQKHKLGAMVNNTNSLSALLCEVVKTDDVNKHKEDLKK